MSKRIHVSIHDVSPAFERELDDGLAMLQRFSIKAALLVVPNFHERAPLTARFGEKLYALQNAGHEIFLHGFTHRAEPGPRTLQRYFRQNIVSGNEAEFASLSREQAALRLQRGIELLREHRLRIDGFVAPAWSFQPWLLPMLQAHKVPYTEDHLRIYDLQRRAIRPSAVLNFASRSPRRLLSTVGFCRIATMAAALLPTRIALHPKDLHFLLLRNETTRLLAWAAGHTTTAAGLFGPQAE